MTLIAQCSTQAIDRPLSVFRVLPAGMFRAIDGRPTNVSAWHIDGGSAANIVSLAASRVSDFVIDYEHQSMKAATNGKPAPAAGWFKKLEWREGNGLYVIDARWTEEAASMIKAKKYRYVSPVFSFDHTGRVASLYGVALTNTPALDGLTELVAATYQAGEPTKGSAFDYRRAAAVIRHSFGVAGEAGAKQCEALALRVERQRFGLSARAPEAVHVTSLEALEAQHAAASLRRCFGGAGEEPARNLEALAARSLDGAGMTGIQLKLCGMMNVAPRDFQATMLADTPSKNAATPSKNAAALTRDQLKVCELFGIRPDDFRRTQATTTWGES